MYDDSVHSGLTTVSQFVPSIFLSVGEVVECPPLSRKQSLVYMDV